MAMKFMGNFLVDRLSTGIWTTNMNTPLPLPTSTLSSYYLNAVKRSPNTKCTINSAHQ